MKVLSIRKHWEMPNYSGNNRFEVEYVDDKGEGYYTAFYAVDELEAYKLFIESFGESKNLTLLERDTRCYMDSSVNVARK